MLKDRVCSVGELRAFIRESVKNEFEPKFGVGYKKNKEKSENDSAVKDIMKDVKDTFGFADGKEVNKKDSEDSVYLNKTPLDLDFAHEPSKEYKERVKALVHGYSSKSNMDNSKDGDKVGDFEGNKAFYDGSKERKAGSDKVRAAEKKAGLKARELSNDFKPKTLYTENTNLKRLYFKNTEFVNESNMLSKIPDSYKFDGNKFIMKDSKGNRYLIECKKDPLCESFIHTVVVDKECSTNVINESLKNFNRLVNYNSSEYNTKVEQLNESNHYNEALNIMRNIKKNK